MPRKLVVPEHPLGRTEPEPRRVNSVSGAALRSIVERIERLNEERAALASDIKEIKAEAKATGFDTKVIAALIRIRAQDKDDLDEFETLLDVYRAAIESGGEL
jgi:uncharacterized protein (UPF0335 family)